MSRHPFRTQQFRVLYREFLFRIVDLELLSAQGDIHKLLGQFVALLVIVSLWILTLPVLGAAASQSVPEIGLIVSWTVEHFLISTTMLVTGLFAVLSWDSAFPDRRDVLVLSPLPVPARTLFVAKVAAVATALSLTVVALNISAGLAAPFAFATAPALPPPRYDAAMAPVGAAGMKPVLDRDLLVAMAPNGALAPGNGAGVSIGILKDEERRVLTYGTAAPDSIFEIGSISKTFTGLILAQMIEQGKVTLDEPVRDFLPPGIVPKSASKEITLLDLATHHSGLPGMPDNLNMNGWPNTGADYHAFDLYVFLAKHGLNKPADAPFLYSNLGFGLLGTALGNRAGTSYSNLLKQEITGPLGMSDTTVALEPEQKERLIQGYNIQRKPVRAWHLDALAPAGAIRSTAGDMLTYLEAQLHPDTAAYRAVTLAAALAASHRLRAEADGQRIALAWLFDSKTGNFWHNGATGGYTSYAFFNPNGNYAGIVLFNNMSPIGFAGLMGQHLNQRLAGLPAVTLVSPVIPANGGVRGIIRCFAAYWITIFAGGAFTFCLVLSAQGLAQLLPRQKFLRLSSFLQMAFFVVLLTVYFARPPFAGPDTLSGDQRLLRWLPSYWFFGLFQQLNGPIHPELVFLARRAWMGLDIAGSGAVSAYLICYFRTLRKIAEQPDILPNSRRVHWLPRFGNTLETAVGQFSVRTLLRSRQHRVILSFYLGTALGLAIFISKAPVLHKAQSASDLWYDVNAPMLVASTIMMCAAVVGARVVFSIPLELRANWIFRVMPIPGLPECLKAARRSLYALAVIPVWLVLAVLLFSLWPWRLAAEHLLILGLLAIIVAELCLYGFQKLPFTCSYLPGKSYLHMAFMAFGIFMFLVDRGATLERSALDAPALFATIAGALAITAVLARWRTATKAKSEELPLQFEDAPDPAILSLGLHRDGVFLITPSPGAPPNL